jgi:hypothetical protein
MSSPLTSFERRILEAFLEGTEPQLQVLRQQAAAAMVAQRTHTGVGAYIDFSIPADLPSVSPASIVFGDVDAEVDGVADGVTSLLYVISGRLHVLEFATYVGTWPEEPRLMNLGYFREVPAGPNGFSLVPVQQRDAQALARALKGREVQSAG